VTSCSLVEICRTFRSNVLRVSSNPEDEVVRSSK